MTTRRTALAILLLAFALTLPGAVSSGHAASGAQIDADVRETLSRMFRQIPGTRDLANRAAGILVFPTVVKAGMGIGGEYGEGALHIGGRTAGYYNTVSASIGFQLGAQARSVIIMFMTPTALANFRRVEGFKVGVDGSVAIVTVGAGGAIDTNTVTAPVIGFILDPKGLMYNLTLEGSKITRISR